jgi:predicted nucleotidyltransferase
MAVTQAQIDTAVELAKKYGATKLLLFGSALTDPDNANDLDLGVDGIPGMKFFEYAGKLENIINIQVDIVDLAVEGRFINHILKVGKFLYDTTTNFN